MAFEHYILTGGKRLRCGYTTGTCAALATAGAARLLLTGIAPKSVRLMTPKGVEVSVPLDSATVSGDSARACVIKDAGDDADVTDGASIWAEVTRLPHSRIEIDGGEGVGRVTKPGLDQPVGAAAINRVPRRMIEEAARAVCDEAGYEGGLKIVISVPEGRILAEKTFNPQLGIEGGISILGTSGIVEPMSMQALIDTIQVEIRQARALGADRLILTPGNYGIDYMKERGLDRLGVPIVKCSNFIGDALDAAAVEDFREVLLIGHAGKLVKLAGGIMNTHSRYADCRTELFCAHAAVCGASAALCEQLMNAATSDACVDILKAQQLFQPVMECIMFAIDRHISQRVSGAFRVGAILFTNAHGLIGETKTAQEMITAWQ